MGKRKIRLRNGISTCLALHNMTVDDLAKEVGSTPTCIHNIIINQYECSIRLAILISLALNISVSDLFWLEISS